MIWILLPALCIASEFFCYKFVKHIDKKERAKLQSWENRYVDSRKDETDKFLEMQKLKLEEKKRGEKEVKKK